MACLLAGPWSHTGLPCIVAILCRSFTAHGADCNQNGVEDALDVAPDRLEAVLAHRFVLPDVAPPLAVADFDGDGIVDVAGRVVSDPGIKVCRSGDHGQEEPCLKESTGERVVALETGDLDADGDADLYALTLSRGMVFLNDGAGGFAPGSTRSLASGPARLALADLDGDADLDAVVENSVYFEGTVSTSVILNRGDGTFLPHRNFATGPASEALLAADFDGDGDADLGLQRREIIDRHEVKSFQLYRSDGAGILQLWTSFHLGELDRGPVLTGDVDGDGDADWLANSWLPEVAVYLSDGRGGIEPRLVSPREREADDYLEALLAVHDWNADGLLDVVTEIKHGHCRGESVFQALWGTGRGQFVPGPKLEVPRISRNANGGQNPMPEPFGWIAAAGGQLAVAWLPVPRVEPSRTEVRMFRWTPRGPSADRDLDGVPDECEPDCNANGQTDDADLLTAYSRDLDVDGRPDECQPDCDADGAPDTFELTAGTADDCDGNGVPDDCEAHDEDANDLLDRCEIASGEALDCNIDGIPDASQLEPQFAFMPAPIGLVPRAVLDLDRDGRNDIVGGRQYLKGRGRGTFSREAISLPRGIPGLGPLADLDADGDLDSALVQTFGCSPTIAFSTLLDAGQLRFTRTATRFADVQGETEFQLLPLGPDPGVGALFFTGDDLFVLDGQGDGSFGAVRRPLDQPLPSRAGRIVPAELNGDSALDLASNAGHIVLQQRAGGFSLTGFFPFREGRTWSTTPLVAADFDGDGDLDLATDLLALNDGHARFSADPGGQELGDCLTAADFDRDGDEDLLSSLGRLLNDGAGRFERIADVYGCTFLQPARDLNGDEYPDLVEHAGSYWYSDWNDHGIRWNRGPRGFEPRGAFLEMEWPQLWSVDFDGDDTLDLIAAPRGMGTDAVWMQHETEDYSRFVSRAIAGLGEVEILALQDLDGDRRADVLALGPQGLELFLQSGEAAFGNGLPIAAGGGYSASADLDDDGDLDLILGAPEGASFLRNDGKAVFQDREALPTLPEIVADFDGDGRSDLFDGRTFHAGDGHGQGAFDARATIDLAPVTGVSSWDSADFNGDGLIDLALWGARECTEDGGGGTVGVLTNEGGFQFERQTWSDAGRFVGEISAADLEGDRDMDLVQIMTEYHCRERDEYGFLELCWNEGDGTLTAGPRRFFDGSLRYASFLVGDWSGDGLPDFAMSMLAEGVEISLNGTQPPLARDGDRDGLPDACGPPLFRRGDANQDGAFNIADAVAVLSRLFPQRDSFRCEKAADVDGDGALTITDAIRLLRHLFLGSEAPPEPHAECGQEPTPSRLPCERFAPCR